MATKKRASRAPSPTEAGHSQARAPAPALQNPATGSDPRALVTFRVSVLSQLLSRAVDAAVSRELGLSHRQWRVLVMLSHLGQATSGDVARATHFDHSQVSRASYELRDKGLIDIAVDGVDRRRALLSPTRAGMQLLRRGLAGSRARQARLRGCVGEDDYAALGRALQALTDEARRLLDEARDGGG